MKFTGSSQVRPNKFRNGRECGGAGSPCEEPECPFRTHPTDAEVAAVDQG